MNKEYIYVDGKVVVKDEQDNQILINYCNNLDEILVQENIIETMEKRIKELENAMDNNIVDKYKIKALPLSIAIFSIVEGVGSLIELLSYPQSFELRNTIFGQITGIGARNITMLFGGLIVGLYFEYAFYIDYKDSLKAQNGRNNELEFLRSHLNIEKEKLKSLQNNKTKNIENKEFFVTKVDDKQKLEDLKNMLMLQYDLGYNCEKYYKYLEQGILEEELKEKYAIEDIELVKEYLQEKGPKLKRKRK